MSQRKKKLPTIWEVDDSTWSLIEAILEEHYPKKPMDRRRVSMRPVLNGIIYRMRSGVQWNQLPKKFGDDSTVHRHFQAWCRLGIFEKIWAVVLECCAALQGVNWDWQAADAAMSKARFGGTKSAATRLIEAKQESNAA